ncbi:hypothetical protein [Candidatus Venteria ishoeyi]|uniref:Uncharacterized protein n=1 Tax=Candidatus Venteria ishoeyi TaxID=1899563 RepID=A0A1H6F448_9GAMM|nr:hypothetical protein [Candidatus Venteria ishoeyi]SEH04927.1 Uncharacterised protein [Candidatus Venteria ishoeyi]
MISNAEKSFIGLSLYLFSHILIAGNLTFEFEINQTKEKGKPWDGLSRFFGAEPAPDIHGIIKIITGEECQIELKEDTFLAKQECTFKTKINKDDKISFEIFDKDNLRRDDIIFIGTVTFSENPTIINFENELPDSPSKFLKSMKIY